MRTIDNTGTDDTEGEETVIKTEILIAKPAGLHALKQYAQDILNAVDRYEKNVKKELAKEDGK